MTGWVAAARTLLRRRYQEQLHLQQVYLDRHDVSGLQALAARQPVDEIFLRVVVVSRLRL